MARIGALGCNPKHMILGVRPIRYSGAYFGVDRDRILPLVLQKCYRIAAPRKTFNLVSLNRPEETDLIQEQSDAS